LTAAFDQLRARLDPPPPTPPTWPGLKRRAAIAVVLRSTDTGPEVLLMRRVERPGDRWSGDISCPGGFQHGDEALTATAIRETSEELGLDLDDGSMLGALRVRPTWPWHRFSDFAVVPFVFVSPSPDPPLRPDPKEVQSARWVPLSVLADPARRTSFWWWWKVARALSIPFRLDRVVHEDYDVWGLTLQILDEVRGLLEP
jgi:8-oxo-dGTP pyrophosphatase MutT (NUDIX family)